MNALFWHREMGRAGQGGGIVELIHTHVYTCEHMYAFKKENLSCDLYCIASFGDCMLVEQSALLFGVSKTL